MKDTITFTLKIDSNIIERIDQKHTFAIHLLLFNVFNLKEKKCYESPRNY